MKVMSWNCNMQFRKDFEHINKAHADLIIIQECEKLDSNYYDGFNFHWVGHNEKKGLGILTKSESLFEKDLYRNDLIHFLPVSNKDFAVLGVWAFNSRGREKVLNGSGYILEALEHYGSWLKTHKNVVVAGDFNNAPQWDIPGHKNNFVEINQVLNSLNLSSAYHVFTQEDFGKESVFTHFHQRNEAKRFHIDYIYSNFNHISAIEVGTYSDFKNLSDHVPISAVLED